MSLHSVLHNVNTAAVLLLQQLFYIRQRKHDLNVQNPSNFYACDDYDIDCLYFLYKIINNLFTKPMTEIRCYNPTNPAYTP